MSKRNKRKIITESGRNVEVVNGDKISMQSGKVVTYDAMVGLDGKVKQLTDVKTGDAFSNPFARLGFGTANLLEATEYPLTRLTSNYALMNSLYRDNWVVGNIVSVIPEDMCKSWYTIKTDESKDLIERFRKMERQTHLKQKIIEGLKWGRLYGGGAALILIKDQMNMLDEPLDINSIGIDDFKGLYVMDRWSGVEPGLERVTDLCDTEYGMPKYYTIKDGNDNTVAKVHHSRILRFIGRPLPYYEKIAELDWGASEVETAYNEVVKRDNVSNNIASLTFKANISIYEMDNVEQLFAVAGSQAQKRFWDMMQAQSILESNLGAKIVNKGDNYHTQQYTFAGLSEVYNGIMMDLAGATHIPVTKLFGRSPAGMNATGDGDLQNYYDYIDQLRESQLRPVIEKLLPILAMSTFGKVPNDLDFEFNDIGTRTDSEKTQTVSQKVGAITQAYQAGIITQKVAVKELSQLKSIYNLFNAIGDEEIEKAEDKTMNQMQQMDDPMAGLSMGDEYIGGDDDERTIEEIDEEIARLMQEKENLIQNEKLTEEKGKLTDNIKTLQNEKLDNLLRGTLVESEKNAKMLDL